MTCCFHCGESVVNDNQYMLNIGQQQVSFCCMGCQAAALFIRDAGLLDYYQLRQSQNTTVGDGGIDLAQWDHAATIAPYVRQNSSGQEIIFLIDGLRCAACVWLIEHALQQEQGVQSVTVNAVTAHASLCWDAQKNSLSHILGVLTRLGYQPYLPQQEKQARQHQHRQQLKRLLVAGLGMMQVMMFSESLYFGSGGGMDDATRDLFRWLGLMISAPVIFYSGMSFLRGAWYEIRQRRPGMDFLVSLTVLLAFSSSIFETLRQGDAVYFDSAVMFVFLLLATRHIEQSIRYKALLQTDVLAQKQPSVVCRHHLNQIEKIALHELQVQDVIRVYPGEVIPADGYLQSETGRLNEAMLTGESTLARKQCGDMIYAGSVCINSSIDICVTQVGQDTRSSHMARLIENSRATRPRRVQIAEQIAHYFLVGLLCVAFVVAFIWWQIDAQRVIPILLSVLAVSCPCALSLAMPTALAFAHARLMQKGVLVLKPDALETLTNITDFAFDKTGTLTRVDMQITDIVLYSEMSEVEVLGIAAALERDIAHPIAHAFRSGKSIKNQAEQLQYFTGQGISGVIAGRTCRLGSALFTGIQSDVVNTVFLKVDDQLCAAFTLQTHLRKDARLLIEDCVRYGIVSHIFSGDHHEAVAACAQQLKILDWHARLSPHDKLQHIHKLQQQGLVVAALGDGMNDAAFLAGASVSFAFAAGAPLTHIAADILLLNNQLQNTLHTYVVAKFTRRIIKQNLWWALVYNVMALPLAAMGLVPPWAAAIGMSLSSLLVTLNALRIHFYPFAADHLNKNTAVAVHYPT